MPCFAMTRPPGPEELRRSPRISLSLDGHAAAFPPQQNSPRSYHCLLISCNSFRACAPSPSFRPRCKVASLGCGRGKTTTSEDLRKEAEGGGRTGGGPKQQRRAAVRDRLDKDRGAFTEAMRRVGVGLYDHDGEKRLAWGCVCRDVAQRFACACIDTSSGPLRGTSRRAFVSLFDLKKLRDFSIRPPRRRRWGRSKSEWMKTPRFSEETRSPRWACEAFSSSFRLCSSPECFSGVWMMSMCLSQLYSRDSRTRTAVGTKATHNPTTQHYVDTFSC